MKVGRTSRWWPFLLVVAAAASAAVIPPAPTTDDYLYDSAGLINATDRAVLQQLQLSALQEYNSPIVVVTVSSAGDYGEPNVDALATRWFDAWNVGTLGLQGGANQGMLLLVGVRDRKARIELGQDWGHQWDAHAEAIMNGTLVPRFKEGDFSIGIVEGVGMLVGMAKQGPHSRPPGDFLERRVRPICKYSVFEPNHFVWMMGLGFAMVLFGLFGRTSVSGLLVGLGIGMMVFAAFTWAVIVLLALFLPRSRRYGWYSSGGGGYSGGGGGYSGGSSGGGGASGSW